MRIFLFSSPSLTQTSSSRERELGSMMNSRVAAQTNTAALPRTMLIAIDFEARLIAKILTRLVFVRLKWRGLRDITRKTKHLSRSLTCHTDAQFSARRDSPNSRYISAWEARSFGVKTVMNRNYLSVVASCNQSPLQAQPERDGKDINETSGVYFDGKENSSPRSESKNRRAESNQRPRCQFSIKSEISFWFFSHFLVFCDTFRWVQMFCVITLISWII